jgi:hypothetical protein
MTETPRKQRSGDLRGAPPGHESRNDRAPLAPADLVPRPPFDITDVAPRKRGRPLEMTADEVLGRIRGLAEERGLFRIHHDHAALYARARRLFGSWAGALRAAGMDPDATLREARRRSFEARRRDRHTGSD